MNGDGDFELLAALYLYLMRILRAKYNMSGCMINIATPESWTEDATIAARHTPYSRLEEESAAEEYP
jgi:hypothetical protein